MDYFVLRLEQVSDEAEAWLGTRAFSHGALGISEALEFRQPEGEEEVFISHSKDRALDVFFARRPEREFLDELRRRFPRLRARVTGEENRDWLAEWKKGFEPFNLAGPFWVVPSWCPSPVASEYSIRIDPGMAFGTGTHETTKLVARELLRIGARGSLLDVGTGTGILAMLGARMGFKTVTATEIEADARRVAHENFALNEVGIDMDERQVQEIGPVFDVVVANIIDGVLCRIQDALKARVKSGGWLVVSGVIAERERDFVDGFRLPPGKFWRREQLGDWLLFSVEL